MKTVLISRSLAKDSILNTLNENFEVHVDALSLIAFEPISFEPPDTAWLFFYSPRAVHYFYQSMLPGSSKTYSTACLGPGTARVYKKITGADPNFIGTGKPAETATLLKEALGSDSICFVSGTSSLRSIQQIANGHLSFQDLAVYKNYMKTGLKLDNYDLAILTSPMNVTSFFSNDGKATVFFALGESTLKLLAEHGKKGILLHGAHDSNIYQAIIHHMDQSE